MDTASEMAVFASNCNLKESAMTAHAHVGVAATNVIVTSVGNFTMVIDFLQSY